MTIPNWFKNLSTGIVIFALVFWYPLYLMAVNAVGPSTRYFDPTIGTARANPANPKFPFVYWGDEFYVNIWIIRHRPPPLTWGTCIFDIKRYAEVVSGPREGDRYLISIGRLQFRGEDAPPRRTRWPQPNEKKIILGYAVDPVDGEPLDGRVIQKNKDGGETRRDRVPIMPDDVDEEEFTFYVVGQYFCNIMDDVIPRFIQGGDVADQTARVYAILKRHKP